MRDRAQSMFLAYSLAVSVTLVPQVSTAEINSVNPPTDTYVQISGENTHVCGLTLDGVVQCWGANYFGQIGVKPQSPNLTVGIPKVISGLSTVKSISSGGNRTCAVELAGDVKCWGSDTAGYQSGGSEVSSWVPVIVRGLVNPVELAVGATHSCAILQDEKVVCWGSNRYGQLGRETGSLPFDYIPAEVPGVMAAKDIQVGDSHTCVEIPDGSKSCWGIVNGGLNGDGQPFQSPTPRPAVFSENLNALALGYGHSCSISNAGGVFCWGSNYSGELGNSTNISSDTKVQVENLGLAVSVGVGFEFSCALLRDETVSCWGRNAAGELGNGGRLKSSTPSKVTGLDNVKHLSVLSSSVCTLDGDGKVKCWGSNSNGTIGTGSLDDYVTSPVSVLRATFVNPPSLQSYSKSVKVGSQITFVGKNLSNVYDVRIGKLKALKLSSTDTSVTFTVPIGAQTDFVTFYGAEGICKAPSKLVVIPAPKILQIQPSSARAGDRLVIKGVNLRGAVIGFGKFVAKAISVTETKIVLRVPQGVKPGIVKVRLLTKNGASLHSFRVIK